MKNISEVNDRSSDDGWQVCYHFDWINYIYFRGTIQLQVECIIVNGRDSQYIGYRNLNRFLVLEKIRRVNSVQYSGATQQGRNLVFMLSVPSLVVSSQLTVPVLVFTQDYGEGRLSFREQNVLPNTKLPKTEYITSYKLQRGVFVFVLGFWIPSLSRA